MRRLSERHKACIRRAMMYNKNAVKDGRYSAVPHRYVCSVCPRMYFCPYFRWGNACVFLWEKLGKAEEDLRKDGYPLGHHEIPDPDRL